MNARPDQTAQSDAASAAANVPPSQRQTERVLLNRPMVALKAAHVADDWMPERFAAATIRLSSTTSFLLAHVLWFGVWIMWNTGVLRVPAFDPYPFGLLTLLVSLEAICVAILVLIGQRREAAIAELREELTLQINLRMEAEVTKGLQLIAGLYTRLGHRFSEDDELREMLKVLDPASMERELRRQIQTITDRV
jgi:uncharacterized membrane protein